MRLSLSNLRAVTAAVTDTGAGAEGFLPGLRARLGSPPRGQRGLGLELGSLQTKGRGGGTCPRGTGHLCLHFRAGRTAHQVPLGDPEGETGRMSTDG